MPRGGKRKGTGRPSSSGENREPTKTVRVPLSFAERIPELLKQHQEENSSEDSQLPAKAHEKFLPLAGLEWYEFEVFCRDLVSRLLTPKDSYHYGFPSGDTQLGIDVVANLELENGERWVFQCKKRKNKFIPSEAKEVIKSTIYSADHYVLLLNREASAAVRDVIASEPNWEVWDLRDISQKVRELASRSPEAARRLVRDHFHPEWQNAFLGISKLTPFISSEDFFHNWLDASRLFNHTWKLEGRNDSLKGLENFVTSGEKVAILPGRGGIGKTKLLYEFAKTFDSPCSLWFVEDGISVTPENADSLPLRPCLIVVDDAHRREQDIITLCKLIHNRIRSNHPEIKLVLSSRPYAVQALQAQLDQQGIDPLKLDELKELSRLEMKALAHQAIGQDYAHFADQLAEIAYDSPLVTVVGGQLLADREIPLNLLERNEAFQLKVLNRFQEIIIGQISEQINSETCKKILQLIAATSPIEVTNEQFQQVASDFIGIDKATLICNLGLLEQAGVLLRRGKKLRITPDVLADHILHKACLTEQGDITGYAEKVFDQFRQVCPTQILSNLAELDWRIQCNTGQEIDLLRDVWQQIRADFQASSHYGRWQILGILEAAAYNQPKQTLDLVKFAIQQPSTLAESEHTFFNTHEAVLEKVPALLRKISYTTDYLPECCNLLWKLGKDRNDNHNSDPSHPIRVLIDLAKYDLYKSPEFNQTILNLIAGWLKQFRTLNHVNLLLDILDPILQKDFDSNYQEGWTVYLRKIPVSYEKTQKLRVQALDLITSCLQSDQVKVVLRALNSLSEALEQRMGKFSQPYEKFVQEWETEQIRIMEIINQFLSQNTNPIFYIEARQILDLHTHPNHTVKIKEKARAVIQSIPDTYEIRLTKVLLKKYDCSWDDDNLENMSQGYIQQIDEMPQFVSKEFLQRYPNASDGIKTLNQKLEEIWNSGFQSIPYDLLNAIAEADVEYATSMCQLLIQQPNLRLAEHLTPLLSQIRFNNSDHLINLIQSALNTKVSAVLRAVAGIYLNRDWAKKMPSADLVFIEKLLNEDDLSIRRIAVMSLSNLGTFHPESALSLALSVHLEGSKELASSLCQLFTFSPGISPEILTDRDLLNLLSKLRNVSSIDNYWIEQFLAFSSQKVPNLVLRLLFDRIENLTENSKNEYQPLPYREFDFCFQLSDCEESRQIVRAILEQALNGSQIISLYLPRLFRLILSGSTLLSITLLDEWVSSGEPEKVQAVSLLLSEMSQCFVFTQVEFLTRLLEQAHYIGDECYGIVNTNLFNALTRVSREGTLGQACQEDLTLRDQSLAIASQAFIGSPAHKFYSSLAKYAENNIARQIGMGKEQMDYFKN
jgi:hypothetical protein